MVTVKHNQIYYLSTFNSKSALIIKIMKICVLFSMVVLASCASHHYAHPRILIKTEAGDIEAELYPDKAPKTVNAFLAYIDSGFYKSSSFYRVLTDDNQP